MARPKSEDKRIALLQAATVAIAQAGISASTASIARSAGVAEGTLFRYFATKDDLLNALYIWLKHDLGSIILQQVDFEAASPKQQLNSVWDNYIDWEITHPLANACMRHLAVSGKITQETEQQVANMFPELDRLCESRIRPIFREPPLRAFGDGLFLALAETTIDFAIREPQRAPVFKETGFETMWRALTNADNPA